MLQRALLVRQTQVIAHEADVDSGSRGNFYGVDLIHDARIRPDQALRSTAIGDVRAIRSVPTQPDAATSAAAAMISSSNGPTGGQ
jgi:hypothetical protein